MYLIQLFVLHLYMELNLSDYGGMWYAPGNASNTDTTTEVPLGVGYGRYTPGVLTLHLIFIILILGNNGAVLAVLAVTKQKIFTGVKFYSVALLSISDLIVGLVQIYYVYSRMHNVAHSNITCVTIYVLRTFAPTLSVFSLLVVAVEQYVAVSHPYAYLSIFSEKKAKRMIAIVVCASVVLNAFPLFGWNLLDFSRCVMVIVFPFWYLLLDAILLYFFPVAIMVVLYTRIFIVARHHIRAIHEQAALAASVNNEHAQHQLHIKSELQVAVTIFVVIGLFAFSCLPFWVLTLLNSYYRYCNFQTFRSNYKEMNLKNYVQLRR